MTIKLDRAGEVWELRFKHFPCEMYLILGVVDHRVFTFNLDQGRLEEFDGGDGPLDELYYRSLWRRVV